MSFSRVAAAHWLNRIHSMSLVLLMLWVLDACTPRHPERTGHTHERHEQHTEDLFRRGVIPRATVEPADKDGTLFESMMGDKLHPTVKGYQTWTRSSRC